MRITLSDSELLNIYDFSDADSKSLEIKLKMEQPKSVKFIETGSVGFTQQDILSISTMLESNESITNLDLSACGIGDNVKTLVSALLKNQHILQLNLSNNHMTNVGVVEIVELLKANHPLLSLDLSLNTGINDDGLAVLAKGLDHNHQLQEINLSKTNISNINPLRITLTNNKTLTHINLNDTNMTEHNVLTEFFKHASLKVLLINKIDKRAVISDLLDDNMMITQLHLRAITFAAKTQYSTDYECSRISQFIARNNALSDILKNLEGVEKDIESFKPYRNCIFQNEAIKQFENFKRIIKSAEEFSAEHFDKVANLLTPKIALLKGRLYCLCEDYYLAAKSFNTSHLPKSAYELFHLVMKTREYDYPFLKDHPFSRFLLLLSRHADVDSMRVSVIPPEYLYFMMKGFKENKLPQKLEPGAGQIKDLIGVSRIVSASALISLMSQFPLDGVFVNLSAYVSTDVSYFVELCGCQEVKPILTKHFGTHEMITYEHLLLAKDPENFMVKYPENNTKSVKELKLSKEKAIQLSSLDDETKTLSQNLENFFEATSIISHLHDVKDRIIKHDFNVGIFGFFGGVSHHHKPLPKTAGRIMNAIENVDASDLKALQTTKQTVDEATSNWLNSRDWLHLRRTDTRKFVKEELLTPKQVNFSMQ